MGCILKASEVYLHGNIPCDGGYLGVFSKGKWEGIRALISIEDEWLHRSLGKGNGLFFCW